MIRLIAAIDAKRGIAIATGVPWKLPGDVAYFHEQTSLGLIVTGWVTYSEFASPLHDRVNYVLTRGDDALRAGFEGVRSLEALRAAHPDDDVWVIGGASVFAATIGQADELFITQVEGDFNCIKFFPPYAEEFTMFDHGEPRQDGAVRYRFERWRRRTGAPASQTPRHGHGA